MAAGRQTTDSRARGHHGARRALGPGRDRPAGRARADPPRGRGRDGLGRARARARARAALRRTRTREPDAVIAADAGHLAAHRRGPARRDGRLPATPPADARQPARGGRLPRRHRAARATRGGSPSTGSRRAAAGSRSSPPARAPRRCSACTASAGPRRRSCPRSRRSRAATTASIALDLPGFGESDKPIGAPYDAPWFARATFEAMDALGLGSRSPRRQQHGRPRRDRGRSQRPLAGDVADAPVSRARLAARPPLGPDRAAAAARARPAPDGAAARSSSR